MNEMVVLDQQIRKIIHLDMDYFYAQVEIRDNPNLKNEKVIIGYGERGVVSTANYEARKDGVYSGMSIVKAKKLCPDAVFIKPNMQKYEKISLEIINIIKVYSDIIERVALDEAYIDVTYNKKGIESPYLIAKKLQREIYDKLKLTCSCGVSFNKFLAKIGSDYKKPYGITVIHPKIAQEFVEKLEINQFKGIGKKNIKKCYEHNIYTGKDLKKFSQQDLYKIFGKIGYSLYNQARAIDYSCVEYLREISSIGYERTLLEDINDEKEILKKIEFFSLQTELRLINHKKCGKCITLKIKYDDFKQITKSKTIPNYIYQKNDIFDICKTLYQLIPKTNKKIRLIGISCSKLANIEIINKQKKIIQLYLPLEYN